MITEIRKKIYSCLKQVSGLSSSYILPENENRKIPSSGVFFVYGIEATPSGLPVQGDPDTPDPIDAETTTVSTFQTYNGVLTLEAYRSGARDAIYNFYNNLFLDSNKLFIKSMEVSFSSIAEFQNLTDIVDVTEFEERQEIKIPFSIVAETVENIHVIDTVSGLIELDSINDYSNTFLG